MPALPGRPEPVGNPGPRESPGVGRARSVGTRPFTGTGAAVEEEAVPGAVPARVGEDLVPLDVPPPVVPVVIGRIEVQVPGPSPVVDPFAGCRPLARGVTARRGGAW